MASLKIPMPDNAKRSDSKETQKQLCSEESPHHCCTKRETPFERHTCHHGNHRRSQWQCFRLKTILMTSLALFTFVLVVQSAWSYQSLKSEIQTVKGELGLQDEQRMDDLEHHIVKRSVKSSGGTHTKSAKSSSQRHKRRGKKLKGRKDKSRVRRSNRGLRAQIQVMQTEMESVQSQVTDMAEFVVDLRDDIGRAQTGARVAVHLYYYLSHVRNLFYTEDTDHYFVWSMDDDATGRRYFRYRRSPDYENTSGIYGVIIRFPGQYQVYSQILVNGRNNNDFFPFDCAHETVVIQHNTLTLLLRTFITQHNLGETFGHSASTGLRPRDSSFQMGVFTLREGDEIRIRATTSCTHFTYAGDRYASHFGLIRV